MMPDRQNLATGHFWDLWIAWRMWPGGEGVLIPYSASVCLYFYTGDDKQQVVYNLLSSMQSII